MTKARRNSLLILSGIVLCGAAIRIVSIVQWHGLSFDEVFSVLVASQPWGELWHYLQWEMHPPGHFVYLKLWMMVFGTADWVLRFSSVILDIMSIIGMYALGASLFSSQRAGHASALLTALNPSFIYNSLFARMYTPHLFSAIGATWFLYHATKNTRIPYWIGFGVCLWLALYTHLTGIALLATYILYIGILYYQKNISRQVVKRFAITVGVVVLTYAPWIIHFVTVRLPNMPPNPWYLNAKPHELFFVSIPTKLFFRAADTPLAVMGTLIILGLVLLGIMTIKRIRTSQWHITTHIHPGALLALLVSCVPLVLLFAANLYPLRYFALSVIGLILLVSGGWSRITQHRLPWKYRSAPLALLAILLLPQSLSYMRLPPVTWSTLIDTIESQKNPDTDVVVNGLHNELLFFEYHYEGGLETRAIHIEPELLQENALRTITQTNASQFDPKDVIDQMHVITDGKERVFFVGTDYLRDETLRVFEDWFSAHNWNQAERLEFGGLSNPHILLFTKSD